MMDIEKGRQKIIAYLASSFFKFDFETNYSYCSHDIYRRHLIRIYLDGFCLSKLWQSLLDAKLE